MGTERRTLLIGGFALFGLGVGWFALSHLLIGTATGDALAEALGVMLALLVVGSIVGAMVKGRGNHP